MSPCLCVRRLLPRYLMGVAGLGSKSTACISLLCLGHKEFPVDTNVARVFARLGWIPIDVSEPARARESTAGTPAHPPTRSVPLSLRCKCKLMHAHHVPCTPASLAVLQEAKADVVCTIRAVPGHLSRIPPPSPSLSCCSDAHARSALLSLCALSPPRIFCCVVRCGVQSEVTLEQLAAYPEEPEVHKYLQQRLMAFDHDTLFVSDPPPPRAGLHIA